VEQVPHPDVDWDGFISQIHAGNGREAKVYDVATERLQPWIHVDRLSYHFGGRNVASKSCSLM
jgi:hypothetical protein